MRTRNYPDLALGAIFTLGGLFVLSQALAIPSMSGLPVGPGLFPTVTGAAMALFGAVLALQSWLTSPASEMDLVPEGQAPDGEEQIEAFKSPGFFSPFVLGILAATLASIFLMPILGFLVTGLLYSFVIVLLGGGRLLSALIFSPIAAITVYAIFAYGFRVPLPRGLLG